MARQEAHRIDGHIFEFIGDDVARGGEGGEARFVVPCRLAVVRSALGRAALGIGGVDMDLVTELRGGEAKHPAEQIGRAHVELQSLMRISYALFCLKKKNKTTQTH